MTSTTRKLIWIKQLLSDLDITTQSSMKLFCDNQAACHIASNPLFHERTNHIKVDCHFIRDKIQLKKIETSLVRSGRSIDGHIHKRLGTYSVRYKCN
jgi:hypothetical protein